MQNEWIQSFDEMTERHIELLNRSVLPMVFGDVDEVQFITRQINGSMEMLASYARAGCEQQPALCGVLESMMREAIRRHQSVISGAKPQSGAASREGTKPAKGRETVARAATPPPTRTGTSAEPTLESRRSDRFGGSAFIAPQARPAQSASQVASSRAASERYEAGARRALEEERRNLQMEQLSWGRLSASGFWSTPWGWISIMATGLIGILAIFLFAN